MSKAHSAHALDGCQVAGADRRVCREGCDERGGVGLPLAHSDLEGIRAHRKAGSCGGARTTPDGGTLLLTYGWIEWNEDHTQVISILCGTHTWECSLCEDGHPAHEEE